MKQLSVTRCHCVGESSYLHGERRKENRTTIFRGFEKKAIKVSAQVNTMRIEFLDIKAKQFTSLGVSAQGKRLSVAVTRDERRHKEN